MQKTKTEIRRQVETETVKFLKAGGRIKKFPAGASGIYTPSGVKWPEGEGPRELGN